MAYEIFIATEDQEIQLCFPVFSFLRPHLVESKFLSQVRRQQEQSYQIVALRHGGEIKSVAGFRIVEFLAWGRVLYVDDLATLPTEGSQGFGGALFDWLIAHAKKCGCRELHLDTGYTRHAAHRLYLKKGLELSGHHLVLELA